MTNRDKKSRPLKPQLFSIFIWPEQTDQSEVSWRGQLKQLESGEINYFGDWDELVKQIQEQLNRSKSNNP